MKNIFAIYIIAIFVIVACSSSSHTPPMNSKENRIELNIYPQSPEANLESPEPYPNITSPYPVYSITPKYQKSPRFQINLPVKSGDMIVTGNGPVDVPLLLVDISEVGEPIAETTIDKSGHFTFTLQSPLTEGHMIGLKIGDLSGTNLHYEDFLESNEYSDIPLIGIILVMAPVTK